MRGITIKEIQVLFDLSVLPHAMGGVARYLISLAAAINETASEFNIDFRTVDIPAAHPGIRSKQPASITLSTPCYLKIPFIRRIPLKRNTEENSRSDRLTSLASGRGVYHHSGVQPFFPKGSRSVVTLYDLSAIENPQWHTDETVIYAKREEELIRNGSYVTAISEWTGHRVIEHFGLNKDRVHFTGGAADGIFSPGLPDVDVLNRLNLEPGGYYLHVGNYVPRKNIPFLLEAYRNSRMKGVRTPLVLVGAGGWGEVVIEESPGVRILKGIKDRTMVELYRGARALLCPSRYEGLGLPVLEAFACDVPVISSNAAALADTVGENGVLLDPDDDTGWVEELLLLEKPERIAELRSLSMAAKRPGWDDIGRSICSFYRRILEL